MSFHARPGRASAPVAHGGSRRSVQIPCILGDLLRASSPHLFPLSGDAAQRGHPPLDGSRVFGPPLVEAFLRNRPKIDPHPVHAGASNPFDTRTGTGRRPTARRSLATIIDHYPGTPHRTMLPKHHHSPWTHIPKRGGRRELAHSSSKGLMVSTRYTSNTRATSVWSDRRQSRPAQQEPRRQYTCCSWLRARRRAGRRFQ